MGLKLNWEHSLAAPAVVDLDCNNSSRLRCSVVLEEELVVQHQELKRVDLCQKRVRLDRLLLLLSKILGELVEDCLEVHQLRQGRVLGATYLVGQSLLEWEVYSVGEELVQPELLKRHNL